MSSATAWAPWSASQREHCAAPAPISSTRCPDDLPEQPGVGLAQPLRAPDEVRVAEELPVLGLVAASAAPSHQRRFAAAVGPASTARRSTPPRPPAARSSGDRPIHGGRPWPSLAGLRVLRWTTLRHAHHRARLFHARIAPIPHPLSASESRLHDRQHHREDQHDAAGCHQRHRLRRRLHGRDRRDDQVLQRRRHRRGHHRQGRPGRGPARHRLQDRGRHPLP